jgi:hypothetical protein
MKRAAFRRTLIAAGPFARCISPFPAALGAATPEAAGRLRLVQVIENGVDGVEGLFGARSAALSPDGAHVYVASAGDPGVAVFARDPETHSNGEGMTHRLACEAADVFAAAAPVASRIPLLPCRSGSHPDRSPSWPSTV